MNTLEAEFMVTWYPPSILYFTKAYGAVLFLIGLSSDHNRYRWFTGQTTTKQEMDQTKEKLIIVAGESDNYWSW